MRNGPHGTRSDQATCLKLTGSNSRHGSSHPRGWTRWWQGPQRGPGWLPIATRNRRCAIDPCQPRVLPIDAGHVHFHGFGFRIGRRCGWLRFRHLGRFRVQQGGLKLRAVPRARDRLGDSVAGGLAHHHPAHDGDLKQHQRPGHQLEQGQQIKGAELEAAIHRETMVAEA